ncbi:MAG: OmpA family protein [Pseudomonadota bacterium]
MKKGSLVLATTLAATMAVTACTTVNPYTREEQTSKAVKGAAIGAAVGAVAGLVTGNDSRDRRQRALIGLGVGAIAGGSVGYYMDVQEAKLRQELEGTGVAIVRQGDNIILSMPGNITFDTNSADINAGFYPVLNSVNTVLKEYDKTLVEVTGHTDSTGSDAINQPLSERRASSVGAYLSAQGLMSQRIATFGVGSNYPVATNDTADGRALNRRVELALVPVTG